MRDINSRNKEKMEKLKADVGNSSDNLEIIEVDVLKPSTIKSAVDDVIDREKKIDVLVNNAGYGLFGPVEFGEMDRIEHMFDTNVLGYIRMIQEVMPHMREKRHGKIINVASMMSVLGLPNIGYYSATKFAVRGFSQALLGEAYLFNIKVSVIAPMGYNTKFLSSSLQKLVEPEESGEYETSYANLIDNLDNFGRKSGKPVDVAKKIMKVIRKKNPPFIVPVGKYARTGLFLSKFMSPLMMQKMMAMLYGFDKMFKKKSINK